MSWYRTAKPGDKIVCVDDEIRSVHWPLCAAAGCIFPEKDRIYSIRHIGYSDFKKSWQLRLAEIINPSVIVAPWRPGEPTFNVRRFRPLVSPPTDIAIFKEILKGAHQRHQEPA
jgi:hypothetical protein